MASKTITMQPRQHGKMEKQKHDCLKRILELDALSANIKAEANQLRKEVVKKFCPWEEGQFIRIKRDLSNETAKIVLIKYTPGESRTINGEWYIKVEPWVGDLSRPAKNRSTYALLPDTEFKVIQTNK